MTRSEDRDVSATAYRATIMEKIAQFKAAIAYDYDDRKAATG